MATCLGVFQFVARLLGPPDSRPMACMFNYVQANSDDSRCDNDADVAQLILAFRTIWASAFPGIMSSQFGLQRVTVNYYDDYEAIPGVPYVENPTTHQWPLRPHLTYSYDADVGGGIYGTVSGDFLPTYCSFRAVRVTAHAGRTGRGHLSLPGVPESLTSGDFLTDGAFTDWSADSAIVMASTLHIDAGDWGSAVNLKPVVWSVTAARKVGLRTTAALYAWPLQGIRPIRRVGTMVRRRTRALLPIVT